MAYPFCGGREIQIKFLRNDEYNAIAESTALQNGVPFINITDITAMACSQSELVEGMAWHPSGEAAYKEISWSIIIGSTFPYF